MRRCAAHILSLRTPYSIFRIPHSLFPIPTFHHQHASCVWTFVTMSAPRIFMSAGEPSGDLHGAALARELRQRFPKAELYGLGGDLMRQAGVRLLAHTDQLAVMGYVEVLRHLPFFARLWREVKREISHSTPDLVVPIDYP